RQFGYSRCRDLRANAFGNHHKDGSRQRYGRDGKGNLGCRPRSPWLFNPSLNDETIAAQHAADPTAAASEWDAEFRAGIDGYLDDALIEQAIEHGRPLELPPRAGLACYRAFVDASGGVGIDCYTIALAHKQGDNYIVDLVRGTSGKFDPMGV